LKYELKKVKYITRVTKDPKPTAHIQSISKPRKSHIVTGRVSYIVPAKIELQSESILPITRVSIVELPASISVVVYYTDGTFRRLI